ncbi:MAG: CoA transferase [Negativicutes bacterium]|jgi:formyl-CoA transferase|nr:CoA transferase [Negativicutes bacterium]
MNQSKGALAGLKVLDLTRVLAGPFSTMMLADMGASVYKLEQPGIGDDSRGFGPFQNGESVYYINLNRNKKGMTIDLKNPKGKAVFLEMVKNADVVIENYRPGVMEKLGLGYEDLAKTNPGIVYVAVSGFGHTGPYSNRPGYDIIAQAMSGLMSTTGWPDSGPTRSGTAIGDVLGGMSATIGMLAAIYHKIKTGEGQKVDIALVDSTVAALEIINMIYLSQGRLPERIGNRYESTYPYDSFVASDGDLVIGAANNKLWKLLLDQMGKSELAEDPRFKDIKDRIENHVEVKAIVQEWVGQNTVDEVVNGLLEKGVPVAPILNIAQVTSDPHIAEAREMFVRLDHPVAGKMRIAGSHLKLSKTKTEIKTPAPALGQDNEKGLEELLGLTAEQVKELLEEGAI